MTNIVRKGANRPAATARTNRHAQRTPLPPKSGSPGAEAIAEAASALAIDSLSAVQAAVVDGDGSDARSWGKAKAFAEKAVAAKWSASVEPREDTVEVTATRGAETVVQSWRGGVWSYEASVYAYGDRTTKPRNASGALKLLARDPKDAAAEASKVASNRHFRKAEPKDIATTLENARRALPFDPGLATDEEICGTLAGQAVIWYNRLSRSNEQAIVGRSGVRITTLDDGRRVANICCPVTGYRSFLVEAILKVGRGRATNSKGALDVAAVEVS